MNRLTNSTKKNISRTAMIISCTDHYAIRARHLEACLQSMGYSVTYVESDFHHKTKHYYRIDRENAKQVHVIRYMRNLSLPRIYSHTQFAFGAIRLARSIRPDLLTVMLPPNSLASLSSKYANKQGIKLIFDIFDMWPETFPYTEHPVIRKLFSVWRNLRDRWLMRADLVFTECDLFRDLLSKQLPGRTMVSVYPSVDPAPCGSLPIWDEDTVHLAYLGSINNIIDISRIRTLIQRLKQIKPVTVHVIGEGERRAEMLSALKEAGADTQFYGIIYDMEKKQQVFDRCRFGINLMRDTVCVGLSMKTVEYFCAGLPIINNIPADTENIINQYGAGINLPEDCGPAAKRIADMSFSDNQEMRRAALRAFQEHMTPDAVRSRFLSALREAEIT